MKGQIVPGDPGMMLCFEDENGKKHEITNCFSASMERQEQAHHTMHQTIYRPMGWRISADFRVEEYTAHDHDSTSYDFDAEAEEVVESERLPGKRPQLEERTG